MKRILRLTEACCLHLSGLHQFASHGQYPTNSTLYGTQAGHQMCKHRNCQAATLKGGTPTSRGARGGCGLPYVWEYLGCAPLQPAMLQRTWRWAWPFLFMAVSEFSRAYQGILGLLGLPSPKRLVGLRMTLLVLVSAVELACTWKFGLEGMCGCLCATTYVTHFSNEDRSSRGAVLLPISMISWSDWNSLSFVCNLPCQESLWFSTDRCVCVSDSWHIAEWCVSVSDLWLRVEWRVRVSSLAWLWW